MNVQEEHSTNLAEQENATSSGAEGTLVPPEFNVTASSGQGNAGQSTYSPAQSPIQQSGGAAQTMSPPTFNVTASEGGELEGESEGLEAQTEMQDGSFDSGDAGEDGGGANGDDDVVQQKTKGGDQTSSGDGSSEGIVPALMLLGQKLDIDVSHIDQSASVNLDLEIVPGLLATRIEIVIEEMAFVSGKIVVEYNGLADVELELLVLADGTVTADIAIEAEILGFPANGAAQITEDGITGQIQVEIPDGHQIVDGLNSTGGMLVFTFGTEDAYLRGDLGVVTADGLVTGSVSVAVELATGNWSGSGAVSSEPREINIASGFDISMPDGFDFAVQFGTEEGLSITGGTTLIPQVTLASAEGIEAGGTAEIDVSLSPEGLEVKLVKVQLAVTGGLAAPEMEDVLEGQHLTSEVDAGAMITLTFEENALSQINLDVTGGIDTATKRIGRINFAGQAELNPFRFIGMLHAVTQADFNLVEGEKFITSVMPGSQLFISLDNQGISNVDASLGLQVKDATSALAQLTVATSLPRGQGLSLAATLELMRRLDITTVDENGFGLAVLPAAGLGAKVEGGALTEINGALPFEVADENGELLSGNVEGVILFTEGEPGVTMQNGTASATLMRNLTMDLAAGEVRILEGASVSVTVEEGKVVSLAGDVSAEYDDGNRVITISASMDYDPSENILRKLDATMATDEVFELFDGKLQISEIEGGISIRNNELVSLGGHARLDMQIGDFELAGEADVTWSDNGDGPAFIGNGWLEFSWFEDGEDPDRYLTGRIDASINGDQFNLLGSVEMGLMKGLTGQATVQIDQEMDPVISASLTYGATLMEANELFAMEFGIGIQIPIIPVLVTVEAGILFGMSINTRPLMVFGTVGVENWRPKAKGFPDFHAELRATWGLDIEAKAMAYLEIILGIADVLHLTGGIRAGVGLNIPIELAPYISVHGGEDGIWGEMGLDLSINPVLKLIIEAYMEWGVFGIWEGEKIWSLLDQELAELGNINWSGSFAFGDKQEPTGEVGTGEQQVVEPQGTPLTPPENLNGDSSLGIGNHENEPESEAGLTGLSDGLDTPSAESAEGDVDQGGLGSEFQKVGDYADGVAAVGDLIGVIADGFQALVKGGPVGLIIWMIFEKPSKDEMQEKRDRVQEFKDKLEGEDLIEPGSTVDLALGILCGEYSFWIIFDKSKPFRDMVDEGLHEEATLEDRAKMLQGLIDGWTTNGDESRIITILQYT
ncbi:MAG: hypothetical protein AAF570_05210, partial [Bacteroidota bacterium]